MGLGQMNKKAQLCILQTTIDSEGFSTQIPLILSNIRVYVEDKHANEKWSSLASFSEATNLFRFRVIPNVEVTTKHYLIFEGNKYDIISVENIKGRNLYIEVLAKKIESSSG